MDKINKIIYADHSATTYVKDEVLKEMLPYFCDFYGNPSSTYIIGRNSKRAIEIARKKVADAIGAGTDEIYFTSCGTESDNMIIKQIARKNKYRGNHIITSKFEHLAVINSCKDLEKEGFEVTYLDVDSNGFVKIDNLLNSIKDTTILISIMYANNEIGTIQDINTIGNIARMNNIYFHTDAVQAIGNVKIDVKAQNIDALSMSAHKFYGPKGIGAAYINKKINFDSFMSGGHQERNKRAGTENVANIVGIGKAIEIANRNLYEYNRKLLNLRNLFICKLTEKVPCIRINGSLENRLPGNVNINIQGIDSQVLLLMLDMNGICVSGGSACNSNEKTPSHVLTSIGLNTFEAQNAIRFTFGEENNEQDVIYIVDTLCDIVKKIRMCC